MGSWHLHQAPPGTRPCLGLLGLQLAGWAAGGLALARGPGSCTRVTAARPWKGPGRQHLAVVCSGFHGCCFIPRTSSIPSRQPPTLLSIADETKFAWKIQRDMAERGHSLESIKASIASRKPDFDAYIDPQKKKADVIIQVGACFLC